MPLDPTKLFSLVYARVLMLIAPLYKSVFTALNKPDTDLPAKRIVLLVSRPQDVELLIGIQKKSKLREGLRVRFWVVNSCARRYPEVLAQLKEKGVEVEKIVSFGHLGKTLSSLMRTDAFLSTVESTTAKRKLPYIITRMANAAGVPTFTLQHGFPNLGLSFCDHVYGTDIRFAAKTVLIWGPVEALPSWVSHETLDKCVAVGCPKELVLFDHDLKSHTSDRPIIAIFENLHGHIYDEDYTSAFLGHLQKAAKQYKEYRFVLKSHPSSLRCRSQKLSEAFSRLEDVEIVDRIDGVAPTHTTPWLLANASGAITNPSTIALDSALAGVPVALAQYGLKLANYAPLTMLDSFKDWETFISRLNNGDELKKRNEEFLGRVMVSGDAAGRILDLMTDPQK